jgi:hypothetical protein
VPVGCGAGKVGYQRNEANIRDIPLDFGSNPSIGVRADNMKCVTPLDPSRSAARFSAKIRKVRLCARSSDMTNITKPNDSPRKSKSDTVLQMLRRRKGATIGEIVTATLWNPHSCRAFLTGVRKSNANLLKEGR